ncbi:2Fe-2S iron-sulfur cluster-binding protein [Mucilaginibacter terrae]|uniref:2Fe-2S iron-sulfur cluster-binding protein n=1 Tax=Mucilaginibacter terrae TaxID=1955052 RepID=UPI003641A0BF
MLQLSVEAIKPETADTTTFYLKEISGMPVAYKAGQFITLIINNHGEEIRRSYSLSSSPHEDLLAVTIKRIPNGEITRYLHTYAQVGDVWNIVEPAGRFTVPTNKHDTTRVYFIAGSGITPAYAHFKYLLNKADNSRILLFYSNVSESSVIFKSELEQLALKHTGRFTVVHLISNKGKRLNNIVAEQLVRTYLPQSFENAQYYLCGPFTYMRMVRLTLLFMGIDDVNIHKENYVLETVPVSSTVSNFAPQNLRIYYLNKWHNLQAGSNQTILQAALQNQLPIPYSCGGGVCAACAVKCKSGKVIMVKNEVLTDAEILRGWVLTCTGFALSNNVELDFTEG